MVETKQIWGKTYVKCYGLNFYRYEPIDDDNACYVIYIDWEEVERCPTQATEAEVRMRFNDICAERGVDPNQMYVWKSIDEWHKK